MKKIITAKEQWMKDLQDTYNKYGEMHSLEEHKVEDVGIGLCGDNEMYRIYDGIVDWFFLKVGDAYSCVSTELCAESLLAGNLGKLKKEDYWYDHKRLFDWIVGCGIGSRDEEYSLESPIQLYELIWMKVYDQEQVTIVEYQDDEDEVSTEEIEDIRKEIAERCKGHSIEELRDMFQGYNWGDYGEDSFDFVYKGFVFCIGNHYDNRHPNEPYSLYLSTSVYSEDGAENAEIGKTITLPIPPKKIKVDMSDIVDEKPDLSSFKSCTNVSFDYMVERMRETCINLITDIYQKIGEKFVEIDTVKWLETHGHFADYEDYYTVALTRNSEGDVVLTGTDTDDWDDYMTNSNWSFVSLEEMLYIINQLTSK